MRAPPTIDVTLQRFGLWRSALLALALSTGAVVGAWFVTVAQQQSTGLRWVVGLGAVGILGIALSGLRIGPFGLRWDGAQWWLAKTGLEPVAGEVHVAIDLGNWMLLRFVALSATGRRISWLPLQRHGLEARWHDLRCTVHAAAPGQQP